MQSDKELLAIMTSGGGISQFYRPIFAFFAFISFIMFMANTSLAPYAHKSFVNLHERIRNQVSMSAVKQGVFNVIGDSVIYIAKKTENTIENVFISYISKNGKSISNIVTAKSGRYSLDNENLYITLDKGYRQELNESNSMISMLAFDNFTYNVTQFVKKYVQKTSKIYNRTQSELLEMARQAKSLKLKNKFLAEFHGRIVMSLTPFINAAIALLFILTIGMKSRKPANSIRVFLCGAILQIILMTLVNASSKYHGLIYANYFIIIAIVLTLIITTLRKKIV
jgi:lipopolysaccharide export LptBFGC system permease protein LptF